MPRAAHSRSISPAFTHKRAHPCESCVHAYRRPQWTERLPALQHRACSVANVTTAALFSALCKIGNMNHAVDVPTHRL